MLKNMLLLAVSAMALAVFALPAAASADDWYTLDEKQGGNGEYDNVELTGEIGSTAAGGLISNGPCDITATIDVWNEPNEAGDTGTGIVTDIEVTEEPCPSVIFGVPCEIEQAELLDLDWHIDVTANTGITITKMGYLTIYNEGCPISTTAVTGDLTGVFNNANSCIEFNNSGDLKAIPSGAAVTLEGKACDDAEALTLKE